MVVGRYHWRLEAAPAQYQVSKLGSFRNATVVQATFVGKGTMVPVGLINALGNPHSAIYATKKYVTVEWPTSLR